MSAARDYFYSSLCLACCQLQGYKYQIMSDNENISKPLSYENIVLEKLFSFKFYGNISQGTYKSLLVISSRDFSGLFSLLQFSDSHDRVLSVRRDEHPGHHPEDPHHRQGP